MAPIYIHSREPDRAGKDTPDPQTLTLGSLFDGSRSNLFYEAIRIVKEMRCATDGRYPRYIVWENVPGAFSSNKGADFQSVLEEICPVKGYEIDPARPERWANAGEIVADDFSLAWRVFDAQYWGVPQRRKRIYLVADFAGRSAGEILFESEGVSGYTPQGFRPWQGIAGTFAEGAGASGCVCLNDQGGSRMDVTEDVAATLRAENHGPPPCVMGAAGFCTEHSAQARGIGYEKETSPTLRAGTVPAAVYENHSQDTRYTGPLETAPTVNATYGMGGNNQPFVVETPKTLKIRSGCEGGGKGALIQENKSATLGCNNDQTVFVPFAKGTRPHSPDEGQQWKASDVANTLNTYDVGEARCNELAVKVYGICSKDSNAMKSDNPKSGFYEAETSRCLDANGGNPTCNQGGMAVVALQGSMIGRADKNGSQGSGVNEDVSFTLDAADHHAVAYCMTNRENVSWLVQNYRWDFDTVVIDELSSFKSNQAQRFKAMKKVRPLVNRVIGLTGTPAPNSLLDLWPQMYLLDMGQRLGRFITGYRERFFTPDKRNREIIYSYKPREGAEKAIYFLISDICISMKAVDYLDMPECIYNRVEVEMSRKERKIYEDFCRDMVVQIGEEELDAVSAGSLSNKLLQMANGAVYNSDRKVLPIHDRKLDALEDLVEAANGKPLLVAYWYKHDLVRIQERFPQARCIDTSGTLRIGMLGRSLWP